MKKVELKNFSKVLRDFSDRSLKEKKAAIARGLARSILIWSLLLL